MQFRTVKISLITKLVCALVIILVASTAQSRPQGISAHSLEAKIAPVRRYNHPETKLKHQATFFNEEFVIFATDESGRDFLLELSLHRKQTGKDQFTHFYTASLIYGSSQIDESSTVNHFGEKVREKKFLKTYIKTPASDLSSSNDYRFNLLLGEHNIEVSLENFSADFLVKNRPEYSKYASAGAASLIVNGVKLKANAYQSAIYSSDYSKYLYFPGYNSIRSNTEFLIVWDEDGDIIVIDSTKVTDKNPHYKSHTWVLYKDSASGMSKKTSTAEVRVLKSTESKFSWRIKLPELGGNTLRLRSKIPRLKDRNEGVVEGVLTENGRNRRVFGLYNHHVYGE